MPAAPIRAAARSRAAPSLRRPAAAARRGGGRRRPCRGRSPAAAPRSPAPARAETGGVARRPDRPGRVVDEGLAVEHPQQARLEIGAAAVGVDQARLPAQRDRHRVDAEVAAAEVGLDRGGGGDDGQRTGMRVGLRAGAGDVDLVAVELDLGGGEALVLARLGPEAGGKRRRRRPRRRRRGRPGRARPAGRGRRRRPRRRARWRRRGSRPAPDGRSTAPRSAPRLACRRSS